MIGVSLQASPSVLVVVTLLTSVNGWCWLKWRAPATMPITVGSALSGLRLP